MAEVNAQMQIDRIREIEFAFNSLSKKQAELAEQIEQEEDAVRLEEIGAEIAEYKKRLEDWRKELLDLREFSSLSEEDKEVRRGYEKRLNLDFVETVRREEKLKKRIQEVREMPPPSPAVVAGTSEPAGSLTDRARSLNNLTKRVLGKMHKEGGKDNFRATPTDEEGRERFEDMEALDNAVAEMARMAGIKKERPDISLIADGAINIGTFRDGEYIPTALKDITEPFSMNSLHITPSMGLRPYVPQPNLTEEELAELDKKYGVKELKNKLRDIMLGYRIDEYDGIKNNLGARQSIARASERMIAAVNELTAGSAMFQAIHSSDPEERVWAQKTMFEIFEGAGNEYEHLANEYIDSLDPETLEKKSKEREAYAREMRSMGEQGIRHVSDPSNMFGAFVLMNFCPPLAIALLAPMLLPNLIAWMSQKGAESAAFAAKDLYSLRLQEKSGVMTAKAMGNIILAKVVPPLVAGVSPEEMSRLIDAAKDETRAWGGKAQEELVKVLERVSKLCADGKTVEPGSAAFAELVKGMKNIGVEFSTKMLDISSDGEVGVGVARMLAGRDMAEAAPGAALFESVDSENGLSYEIRSREVKVGEIPNPPLFKSESEVVKNMTGSIIKDGENYISNLGQIQETVTAFNRNLPSYLWSRAKGGEERKSVEQLGKDFFQQYMSGADFESSLFKKEILRGKGQRSGVIQGVIDKNIYLSQMTQSDAVMGMISLRKPGDAELGKNINDSSFHYVRYGMARDDKGVRVGRNIDVKPPAIFSVMKVMGKKVSEEERREEQLEQEKKKTRALLAKLEAFSALSPGSAEEAHAKEELKRLVKETRDAYTEQKSKKPEDAKTEEIKEVDPDSARFKENVLLPLEQALGLTEKVQGQGGEQPTGANKLRDIDLPLLLKETELEKKRVITESRYCKIKGHDMLSAFMTDMSMRIVPQEAWGAIYTLDRKFMDARERNQRAETRAKEDPLVKDILKDNPKESNQFNLITKNVALAAEKLHEANKLSIAAFVMSKQLQAETERRIARGGEVPSPAENMVASVMTGMLSQAASLEMEAAPIMAKAASMASEGFSKDFSAPAAAALTTIVTGHARSVAELTGGDLLYKRIGQAEESLGHDIRKMIKEPASDKTPGNTDNALDKALNSGLLSGSVWGGDLSENLRDVVLSMRTPDWEDGGAELKSAREEASEYARELYVMRKKRDQLTNEELRKLLNVGVSVEDIEKNGPEKWKDTVSLLTAWGNETSMSGLVTRLVGSHLDAEIGGATGRVLTQSPGQKSDTPLPENASSISPRRSEEPAPGQEDGFLGIFNM